MAANRRRDTGPERAVRSLLHAAGLRYRVDLPVVIGGVRVRPDIAFTRAKLAVFIDGCFWHSCPEHGTRPATNTGFWSPKLDANVRRDTQHTRLLRQAGWQVLRFWEHEAPTDVAEAIAVQLAELQSVAP